MSGRVVGIFGGSFDPVHLGHVRLARYALAHAGLDEVWLMVSPRNPLKTSGPVASDADRLAMARLAVEGIPALSASDFEFSLPVPSYSWLTLSRLREAYPDVSFRLIIGGDNWADFSRWSNPDLILREFGVIVYPRPGEEISSPPPGVTLLAGAPLMEVSSTEIRSLLSLLRSDSAASSSSATSLRARLQALLPPSVLAYILSRSSLYP